VIFLKFTLFEDMFSSAFPLVILSSFMSLSTHSVQILELRASSFSTYILDKSLSARRSACPTHLIRFWSVVWTMVSVVVSAVA
jgi:hypothetical protein